VVSVPSSNAGGGGGANNATMAAAGSIGIVDAVQGGDLALFANATAARATAFVSNAAAGTIDFNIGTKVATLLLIVFACYWSLEVLRGIGTCTLAGAVSKWYWFKEGQTREGSRFPIWGGFVRTLRYHLGTICFGALLLRVAELAMVAIGYMTERLRKRQGSGPPGVVLVARCCLACVVCCIEKWIRFLTSSSYIVVAVQGGAFFESTKRAFNLMRTQVRLLAMVSFTSSVLLTLIIWSIAFQCAGATFLVLKFSGSIPNFFFAHLGMTDVATVTSPALPVAVTFVFSYLVAESFLDVFHTAVHTIFLCYCADVKLNKAGGTLARPMLALEKIKQSQEGLAQEQEHFNQMRQAARKDANEAQSKEEHGELGGVKVSEPDDEPDATSAEKCAARERRASQQAVSTGGVGQKVIV